MTDNEIIKALECCIHSCCVSCPCADDDANSCNYDKKYVLDLINRQKAEIEKWKKKANTPFAKVTFDENKLKEIVSDVAKNIEFNLNLIKSEAIKEFAEKLKRTITNAINTYYNSNAGGYYLAEDVIEDIDNLVEEMTEVNENDRT